MQTIIDIIDYMRKTKATGHIEVECNVDHRCLKYILVDADHGNCKIKTIHNNTIGQLCMEQVMYIHLLENNNTNMQEVEDELRGLIGEAMDVYKELTRVNVSLGADSKEFEIDAN